MKHKFTKKITTMLATILVAAMFFTIPASAIEWNGSTGGGGGGGNISNASGSYSIPYTGNYAVGYRFSRIDYYGITKNKPIDILCSTFTSANYPVSSNSSTSGGNGYSRAKSAEWFETKYNKVWLKSIMYSSSASCSTSKTLANVYTDTDVLGGATLPPKISNIESTVMGGNILDKICKVIGMTNGATDLQNGDKVLVEPIFLMKIASTDYAMTISELGMFGGYMFGWDEPTSTTYNTGSYGFIANFLNKIWPSTLYSADTKFWNAGYDASANTSGPASNAKGLISFRNLLLYGFGIGFAYNNTNPPTVPVDLYPTSVTYWTSKTGGSQVTNLVEGGTYWPRFTYHNNGSIAVTARVSAWSYSLDKFEVNNKDITIGANSDYTVAGDYSITINNNLYYRNNGEDGRQKYDTYKYNQNVIVHDWSITLTDSKATESNPDNNWKTYSHKFSPKQPDISQWIIDRENASSSWITEAVNNRIIYSGEQTNSQVRFTNISSFKLQIDEYFKALLGLNNNSIASYSKTDDPTWHNSGEVWDRETGTFRAKNTENGTNKILYLRTSAGERSFASAMGINIGDANHITENINLNKQAFFKSQTHTNTTGDTVTANWDNDARTLLLNGTMDTIFIGTSSAINIACNLRKGNTYKVTVEYVSGSLSSPNNPLNACIAFQTTYNNGSDRIYTDVSFPKCNEQNTSAVCTGQFTMSRDESAILPWIWIYNDGGHKMTFKNYKVKIKIENITSSEKLNAYSTNLEGYTVIPTDLEVSTISLFDTKTNKRIPDGTILKAGQEVYSETTYTNNTDTSVAVELQTKHDNNSYTGYYMTDDTNILTQCNIASDSNSIHNETCVISPNQSITIRSDVFTISALPHNKIYLSAYIYIKGLTDNTEYEYVTTNNVISKSYVIETPFKPTVIQANSQYRKGITVITSFNVKNDSYLDFGTRTDINNIGVLSAKLKVYKNSSLTGTPIADVDCVYAVPGNGKSTLVWFEWTVPTDSPDKLYAEMVCDNNNIYSSSEFKDNGGNSKNTYCTFNIMQPKVVSTPDTTFSKKAPYWYENGALSASVPSKATGLNLVYKQEAGQIKDSTSWSYYVANGDTLKLITESATLMNSSIDIIPDGTLSAYVGYDNKWNIKSGYGFKIDTKFKENVHSTSVQSGYAVFPEFLYKVVDNNSSVNGYTNGAGTRVGFKGVLSKYPLCGGEYATYSTFEKTSNGKLILPNNDSSHTPTHFIPVWYPNSDYQICCYVADCWTPGGMLSGEISSSVIHVSGNMYDDYKVSEK